MDIFLFVLDSSISHHFRPTFDNGGKLGAWVGGNSNRNIGFGADVEHKINGQTSIFAQHKSTFGNSNFHEARCGIQYTFGNVGKLGARVGGNSKGNVGAGISYGIDLKRKNR